MKRIIKKALKDLDNLADNESRDGEIWPGDYFIEHRDTIRKALSLMSDPEWVYVPREITPNQHLAVSNYILATDDYSFGGMYKIMIAAAPEKGSV